MRVQRTTRELLDDARAYESTDPLRARVTATQARTAARADGDLTELVEATYRLSSIAFSTGNIDESFSLAIEARALAEQCGDDLFRAQAMNVIGMVHCRTGNNSEALAVCLDAVALYRTTGHRVLEGSLLTTVAAIFQSLGNSSKAIETYEAALTANQGLDLQPSDAITLANIAGTRCDRGEYMLAIGLGEHALQLSIEHCPEIVPEVRTILGRAYAGLGNRFKAESLFAEAIAALAGQRLSGNSSGSLADAYCARGRMFADADEFDAALIDLRNGLNESERCCDLSIQLECHEALSTLLKRTGDFRGALHHQEARFELRDRLFNDGTDLRIRTLQVVHETEAAQQRAAILDLRTNELEAMVRQRTADLEDFQLEALHRLTALGEFRGIDSSGHAIRVGELAADTALQLDLDETWCELLRSATRLHDIGKIGVGDRVLLKVGPLTDDEAATLRTHAAMGAQILTGSSSPLLQLAESVAAAHHERWDGHGYPNGLSGEAIPLAGRIVAVADVFDALTGERSNTERWSIPDAVHYVMDESGAAFDPMVVAAFVRVIARRHPDLQLRPKSAEPARRLA